MNSDTHGILRQIALRESVQKIHSAITEQFPTDGMTFDAWYTRRDEVWKNMDRLSQLTADKLRRVLGIQWRKDLPGSLLEVLKTKGTAPENWEDGPDGTLAGLAIITCAWIAHQSAQKTRDNPDDIARKIFEERLKPLIMAAMEDGIKMAEDHINQGAG